MVEQERADQNARISVNVSGLPQNLQSCLHNALYNWNVANGANGNNSGVTFLGPTYNQPPNVVTDSQGNVVSGGTNVLQINYQTPPFTPSYPNEPTPAGQEAGQASGGVRINAVIFINPAVTDCNAFIQTLAHELGHTMGLGECSACTTAGASVMAPGQCAQFDSQNRCIAGNYNNTTYGLPGPTSCDNQIVRQTGQYNGNVCSSQEAEACETNGGFWVYTSCYCSGGGGGQYCPEQQYPCHPNEYWSEYQCRCVGPTPILIDTTGNGFALTNAGNGVNFDINGHGNIEQIAWTVTGTDDAWLVLDRNGNSTIDSGKELFGGYTVQPASVEPNGFLALAEYDKSQRGGNGDGWIDNQDSIFDRLRLWTDVNHNGISEQNELHRLASKGIARLELDYRESRRTDAHGNQFKYRAKVRNARGAQLGRWAWDVILVTSP